MANTSGFQQLMKTHLYVVNCKNVIVKKVVLEICVALELKDVLYPDQ